VTPVDARALLDAGPDGYTAARDAEVRRLRSERDRDAAATVKALTKPSLALWAVLAAAGDAKLARDVVATTTALADTQGAAVRGKPEQISRASAARRNALEAVSDAAIAALAAHDKAVTAVHRAEIRTIIDRVSRHPELLDEWLDATLRDVPGDAGFDAFAAITPAPPRPRTETAAAPLPRVAADDGGARRRAKADEARAKARAAVDDAERAVAAAEHAAGEARRALAAAEKAHDNAERDLDRARRALEAATRKLEAADRA
jgi:hypothetical protein